MVSFAGSARQAIFEAYGNMSGAETPLSIAIQTARWGCHVQMTKKQGNDWSIVARLTAGQVRAAVENNRPDHIVATVLYLYGPYERRERDEMAESLQIALYQQAMAHITLPGSRGGKPTAQAADTLFWLCRAALYHYSEISWPYKRDGLTTPHQVHAYLMQEHGIDIDTRYWSRRDRVTWGSVWDELRNLLNDWEAPVLRAVSRVIAG